VFALRGAESQLTQERFHQPVIAAAGQPARLRFEIAPAFLDGELELDELIECKALARRFRLARLRRENADHESRGEMKQNHRAGFRARALQNGLQTSQAHAK
jgi:hypothetical protein